MTIGLGVLATGEVAKPDTVILAADTQGSFGGWASTNALHKIFCQPKEQLYIAAADDIGKAAELVAMIQKNVSALSVKEHGPIQHALITAVRDYHMQRAAYEVLPKFMLSPLDLKTATINDEFRERVENEVAAFYIGCELLVGTFSDSGQAFLYQISGRPQVIHDDGSMTIEYVHHSVIDGFAAIGSGSHNALFWLAFRNHSGSCSPERAAYHAYEARLMAETSAFVNDQIEMVVATREGYVRLTKDKPKSRQWSLHKLAAMYKKYGPQPTEPLGIPPGKSKKRDDLFNGP
jgi:20S proteasome alpha/beta subunit